MRRFCITVIIAVLGASTAIAQDAPKPAAPLSELETLRLDHLALREAYARLAVRLDVCTVEKGDQARELGNFRAQLASQELTQDEAALKKAIEAARPGFEFNPKTRALTLKPPTDQGKK